MAAAKTETSGTNKHSTSSGWRSADGWRGTVKRALSLAAAIGIAALGVYVMANGFGSDPHEVPFMLSGKPAPDFSIKRLDTGETVTLSQFKGQPVVLNFWATWCGPCAMEHPSLEWGARKYKDRVVFLGIVFEDTEPNTKRFLADKGWSFTQLFDPKSTVAVDYAVSGVPETYFITRDGIIMGKWANPIDRPTLDAKIKDLLR